MQRLLFILLLAAPLAGFAQCRISGKVEDARHHPLLGASIYIKGSYDGTTSGTDGNFSFTTSEKGGQAVVVSLVGYQTISQQVNISGGTLKLNPVLQEAVSTLNMVTISAGSFEASDANRNTILKPLDIVTTAGAGADIASALRTLPGTQVQGQNTGLFVRGGTGAETQTFIDGMLVANPFFSSVPDIAQRGRFSPFLFKGTIFSSGGYSAQYGQGLSGAIILQSDDLPEQSSASLSVSSVGLGGGIDKLSKDSTGSIGGDINYTTLAPYFAVVKQNQDFTTNPALWNGDFNFRKKTSKTGMLKFYGYANSEQLGFYTSSLDFPGNRNLFTLNNGNVYTNMTYTEYLDKNWKLYLGASYSTNTDKIKIDSARGGNNFSYEDTIFHQNDLTQGKVMLTRSLGAFSEFRFGGEYQYLTDNTRFNQYTRNFFDNYTAAFAEGDIYFTTKLVGRIGGRMENSSLLNKFNFAPRISLAYKVDDKGQFSLAYGDFYERPDTLAWLGDNHRLDFVKARHYIANFQRVSNDYTFRVEAYYKKYYGLVKTSPDTSNAGSGYAKGVEVFWRDRKTFKNVDYWISYSYLDTRRDWLNYPYAVQPDFAATHTLTLVYKQFFPKISTNLSATYSFATGRPYYDPNLPENAFMSEKTLPYNSLGLSAAYLTRIRKAFTVFVVSVSNVLGSQQVFGYNYSKDGASRQAITMPATRFIFIGMFMSFGINRSQDVINNNM
ncbi:MAG TPA: TonB-dependent receptor [Chitinophagaceae bacterium]